MTAGQPLRVGIAGLGAIGAAVAHQLEKGMDGLVWTAAAVRDPEKAKARFPSLGKAVAILELEALPDVCDIIIEGLPPKLFMAAAKPAIEKGRIFMPLSVGQLLQNWELVDRAKETGARILVPTGALIGLDAVRAASEGKIESVTMITRKPPAGLEGAPYLEQNKISVRGLNEPKKVFDGTAREGARGFPANVNVAAALSLAGIGPDRTRLEIWADPALTRNTHRIEVEADSARFSMAIENKTSPDNPKTGLITGLSTIAALRGLTATLKVGT